MQIRFAFQPKQPTDTVASMHASSQATPKTGPQDSFRRTEETASLVQPDPTIKASQTRSNQDKIAKIQDHLDKEWKYFGRQYYDKEGRLVRRGISEEDPRVFKRVGYFWEKGTGFKLDGKDRDWPWSAAFISTMHEEAEVGPQFRRSPAHARYIRDAIFSKKARLDQAAYWGHRITERAPQVGDMVCYSRQKGVSYDRQPKRYKSHADIVTAVRPGEVDVVGGNVGQSVSKRTLKTDENGLIVDTQRNWFAVLEPKNLSQFSITPPESEETSYPKRQEDWSPDMAG